VRPAHHLLKLPGRLPIGDRPPKILLIKAVHRGVSSISNQTLNLTDELYQYLLAVSSRESDLQAALRHDTANNPLCADMKRMQIAPEQGQFMQLIIRLLGAKRTIEVGVFTGYSALAVALALPDDGQIIACDISEEWTQLGQTYWQRAGVDHKIDLRIAPASETLDSLIAAGESGLFDFAFIDADKTSYPTYFEQCLQLLRPGGLIAIDNVLWNGSVIDPANQTEDTQAIRVFNKTLHTDPRIELSLIPIGDGLTLARKV